MGSQQIISLLHTETSELQQPASGMHTDKMHFKNAVGPVQILLFAIASGHGTYNYIEVINILLQDRHSEGHQFSPILHWAVCTVEEVNTPYLQLLQASP